jgi:hypothetical protein
MVEDMGTPGTAINASAHDTARYMGAQYERRIVNVTAWNGSFDWKGQVEPYVNAAVENGLKPYLSITADPGWSSGESRIPSAANFKAACSKAATEFKGKVFDYAVWNEPNLTNVGNLSPSDYLNLYKSCREGIKSVSSAANVYFGEFSTAASGWGGMNACEYIRAATPVNAGLVTEGIAIHPYQFSSSPKTKSGTECNGIGRLGDWEVQSTGAKNANALKTASGGSAPILISEFGYCGERPPYAPGYPAGAAVPACPQNASGTANVQSEATRATWLKEAFEWTKLFANVTVFDYHTVVKRPVGNYLGNSGYLWETGIVNQEDGSWTPSVGSLREAVKPASGAPTVTTEGATSITATGATLSGAAGPNGLNTSYRFEYGTTTAYGSSTQWTEVGWAGGAVAHSASITGLQPGTTYHYRIVAKNVAGTSAGVDQVFTAPILPPTAVPAAATSVTSNAATLNSSINPNGLATNYHFEYGTTTAYGTTAPVPDSYAGSGDGYIGKSLPVSGLQVGTTYHFRVVATNSAGTTYSPDQAFATLPRTAEQTGPTAIQTPGAGHRWVYFVGRDGVVWEASWIGPGWAETRLGGSVASHTNLTATYIPSSGRRTIYYVNTSGTISYWAYSPEGGWTNGILGGHAAGSGNSPLAVYDPNNDTTSVFYVDTNHTIWKWRWSSSTGWVNSQLGGQVATGTNLSYTFIQSSDNTTLYYVDSSGSLAYGASSLSGSEWSHGLLGGQPVHAGTSPSASYDPAADSTAVFYVGGDGALWGWIWTGGEGWRNGVL